MLIDRDREKKEKSETGNIRQTDIYTICIQKEIQTDREGLREAGRETGEVNNDQAHPCKAEKLEIVLFLF